MKTTVLDVSAMLAMFFGQPGMEQMRELFHKASEADRPVFISAVNWAEVLYKVERKHGKTGLDTWPRTAMPGYKPTKPNARRGCSQFSNGQKSKKPEKFLRLLLKDWRQPTLAEPIGLLPSARLRLTAEFGMGSGRTTALWPPKTEVRWRKSEGRTNPTSSD